MEMELGEETLSGYSKTHQDTHGKPVSEEKCALMMKGLLQGIVYMHDEQNVIHRDLKPDNILIGDYDDLTQIKIIDFGLACKDNVMSAITDFTKCGTFLYKPPE